VDADVDGLGGGQLSELAGVGSGRAGVLAVLGTCDGVKGQPAAPRAAPLWGVRRGVPRGRAGQADIVPALHHRQGTARDRGR